MASPRGWYSDPTGRYLYRYWDGQMWGEQVSNGGAHSGTDPELLTADIRNTPPAPGTQAPDPATSAPPPSVQVTQRSGSSVGTILGVLVAILAIVVLVVVLVSSTGDGTDDTTPGTDAPPATEAPATTAGS